MPSVSARWSSRSATSGSSASRAPRTSSVAARSAASATSAGSAPPTMPRRSRPRRHRPVVGRSVTAQATTPALSPAASALRIRWSLTGYAVPRCWAHSETRYSSSIQRTRRKARLGGPALGQRRHLVQVGLLERRRSGPSPRRSRATCSSSRSRRCSTAGEVRRVAAQLGRPRPPRRSRGARAGRAGPHVGQRRQRQHVGPAAERLLGPAPGLEHPSTSASTARRRLVVGGAASASSAANAASSRTGGRASTTAPTTAARASSSSSATVGYGDPASPSFCALSSPSSAVDRRRAGPSRSRRRRRAGAGRGLVGGAEDPEPDGRALVDQRGVSRAPRGRPAAA